MARSRGPLLWPVALAGAGVIVALILVAISGTAPSSTDRAQLAPAPPPRGAYLSGGSPRRDIPALDHAFASAIPQYAIALDRWANSNRGPADDQALARDRAEILRPEVTAALGKAAATRLAELIARARDAAGASPQTIDDDADALSSAVIAFNDETTAAGLAYMLDSDVIEYPDGRRMVLLFSFLVDRVNVYASATSEVRALHLRRLDKLNWSYTLLGFTSPRRREAYILIAQVDDRLVDRLLPQLGDDPPAFYRFAAEASAAPWYPRLAARANELVRREYGEGAPDPAAARRVGDLLARRKRLFARWDEALAARGISIEAPDSLRLAWDYRTELGDLIDADELEELGKIETALASAEVERAFAGARHTLVGTVERHEVQHRLDNSHPNPLPMPAALAAFVGKPDSDREHISHPLAELSAYLAELARDSTSIGVSLAILVQFLVDPVNWNSAECYAGLVILEELAVELGLDRPLLVVDYEINRDAVVDLFIAITDRPGADLSASARRLWEKMFDRPLVDIELRSDASAN